LIVFEKLITPFAFEFINAIYLNSQTIIGHYIDHDYNCKVCIWNKQVGLPCIHQFCSVDDYELLIKFVDKRWLRTTTFNCYDFYSNALELYLESTSDDNVVVPTRRSGAVVNQSDSANVPALIEEQPDNFNCGDDYHDSLDPCISSCNAFSDNYDEDSILGWGNTQQAGGNDSIGCDGNELENKENSSSLIKDLNKETKKVTYSTLFELSKKLSSILFDVPDDKKNLSEEMLRKLIDYLDVSNIATRMDELNNYLK
jgi:hypothetical protein